MANTPASPYPPYRITPAVVRLVGEIGESLGNLKARTGAAMPRLSRINRIKTIQGTLEIEGNSLTVGQVTAVLEGRRVLAEPREIQEVRNAFAAYEKIPELHPHLEKDLLTAHGLMMFGLVDELGRYRCGSVGVHGPEGVVHIAPQAKQVPGLMSKLFDWLKLTDEHPLIAGSVFHYEFEAIHPFQDGNGRVGRLWQTLILGKWNPVFNSLPVESMFRDNRSGYYDALNNCNKAGESTEFVEFALEVIRKAVEEAVRDQVSDQVSDQVGRLLEVLKEGALSAEEIMKNLQLKHRASFRKSCLIPAMKEGLVEMTQPDSPRSPSQRYRLTDKGRVRG